MLKRRLMLIGARKCWQNTLKVDQRPCITSTHLTNHESMHMSRKQNKTDYMGLPRWAKSNKSCSCKKHIKQMVACFFSITSQLATVALQQCRKVSTSSVKLCSCVPKSLPQIFGQCHICGSEPHPTPPHPPAHSKCAEINQLEPRPSGNIMAALTNLVFSMFDGDSRPLLHSS